MSLSLNTFQKIILLLFSICIVLNIYYEVNTKEKQVILNPNPWNSFPKEEDSHWVDAGLFELRAYITKVNPFHKNNLFGLTYDVFCEIRYKAENHKELKNSINSYYKEQTLSETQSMQNAKHIKPDNNDLLFSEYAFSDNPSYYYLSSQNKKYYKSNSGLNIQFYSPYFTPKYIKLNIDNKNAIWVKTNPLLLFNSNLISSILFGLGIVLLVAFAIYGGYESVVFLMVLFFYFYFSEHFLWFYFLFLFSLSIFLKIKMRAIIFEWLALPFVYWKALPFIFISLVLYIHKWEKAFNLSELFLESLLALFFMFITWMMLFVSSTSIYSLYIYIFCKEKNIENLKFVDFSSNMDIGHSGRRIPYYESTVILNSKTIQDVKMNFRLYAKVKANKKVNILKYKTDNRGNYIFY